MEKASAAAVIPITAEATKRAARVPKPAERAAARHREAARRVGPIGRCATRQPSVAAAGIVLRHSVSPSGAARIEATMMCASIVTFAIAETTAT